MQTVVVFSGGLDSTVLLYHLIDRGDRVAALSVDYGQRHRKELHFAAATVQRLGVEHAVADLSALRPLMRSQLALSSQVDDVVPVPEGHYAEESMKQTIVPNRNMLLLAAAGAWAISRRADLVAYAAHAGDHAIYPDCREEFVVALDAALRLADWHPVRIARPFVHWTKAGIVERGAALGVPFAETWSCYKGGAKHCGKCGTCYERREAFQHAGVLDPTEYE